MFLNCLVFLIVFFLPPSQQCDRSATILAIRSVIDQLEDLSSILKNNVRESYSNSTLSTHSESGRGSKDYGLIYLIPLFVGAKTAGLTAAAFTVIKLFIIQAFIFSKLAVLSLSYLVLKKLLQYNAVHVYKTVAAPTASSFGSGGYDYLPNLHSVESTAHTIHSGDGHPSDNTQYSTILQSNDAHNFNLGSPHHEDTQGFSPHSGELTGLGSHAAPDLQGQFSITSQNKVSLSRPLNGTSKADDRLFKAYPFMNRRRNHYPTASLGSVFRHKMTH